MTHQLVTEHLSGEGSFLYGSRYESERLTEKYFCCPVQNHNAPGDGHEH